MATASPASVLAGFVGLSAMLAGEGCVPPTDTLPNLPPLARCADRPVAAIGQKPATDATKAAAGWSGNFMAWVKAHESYPEYSRLRYQQGSATIRFRVARDGHESRTCLVSGSGFPVLDAAVFRMFDGALLPPIPATARMDGLTLTFTMHFVLKP